MAKFCSKCGAQMDDNLMFCGNCGASANAQAPARPAGPTSNIDVMAILKGKADPKTNWIVALLLQVISTIFFILPIFRTKTHVDATRYSKEVNEVDSFGVLSEDWFKEMGVKAFTIVMLIMAVAAIIYMLAPVLRKTELNPAAAVAVLVTQATIYLSILFYGIAQSESEKFDGGYYKAGFSVAGWFYIILGAIALFAIVRVVYEHRKKLA